MKSRSIGQSNLKVSVVGLGCNNFGLGVDREAARKVLSEALDRGITFIDTADVYGRRGGSESILGEILGERRGSVVLATKFSAPMAGAEPAPPIRGNASRSYIMDAVNASLKRLRTDWIDLYQLHWPDPATPMIETLRALEDLIRHGKVRYIGCSNLTARQISEAHETARQWQLHGFISTQEEYSLLTRAPEKTLLPILQDCALGLIPYFPLASGLLTGKYRLGLPPPTGSRLAKLPMLAGRWLTAERLQIVEKLIDFCGSRGHTLLELAISWLAAQPAVASVIAGATTAEQVQMNCAAVDWRLTPAELGEVGRITRAPSAGVGGS